MTSQINHINEGANRTGDRLAEADGETSNEIRENIEHKRRSMGSKLDQIQERLDPRYLADQTQEVVRNVVADGTEAMMDYVRDNTRELGSSLTHALKRHPLPAALIGLGLVWLMFDNITGSSESSSNRSRFDRPRNGDFDPSNPDRRFYDYERAARDNEYRAQGGSNYGSGSGSTPSSDPYGRSYSQTYGQNYGQNYGQSYGQAQGSMPGQSQGSGESSLKEKAADAVETVTDKVSGAVENVRETVKEWGQEVGEKASEMGGEIRERMGDFRQDAQWQSRQFRHQATDRARQVSSDNPLMTGAIAFAIGAAAGLLLPPTRKENEWMGDAREKLVSNARQAAQETADVVVQRAESIVQEVKPEVEQAVKEIGESVKRTGQEAADRMKETMQTTKAKVEHEVKNEVGKLEEKMESKTTGTSGSTGAAGSTGMSGSTGAAGTMGNNATDKPAAGNSNPNRPSSSS